MIEKISKFYEYEPQCHVEVMEHESDGDTFESRTYFPPIGTRLIDDNPVLYACGYGMANTQVAEFVDNLAQKGRVVTVIDEPMRPTIRSDESDEYRYLNRNTDFMEQVMSDLGYQRFDVVAHSMGSVVTRRLHERSGGEAGFYIDKVVDMAPAGQDISGGFWRQTYGGVKETLRMFSRMDKKAIHRALGRNVMNFVLNSKASGGQQKELSRANVRESNTALRKDGVKLGALLMGADGFYRQNNILFGKDSELFDAKNEDGETIFGRWDAVASFRRPMAAHGELVTNPAEVATSVDDMLRSLNEIDNGNIDREVSVSKREQLKERARVRIAATLRKYVFKNL